MRSLITKSFEEVLDVAKEEFQRIRHNEYFVLRDLFIGYEWNRMTRSLKLRLGREFSSWIEDSSGVKVTTEVKNGAKVYCKL